MMRRFLEKHRHSLLGIIRFVLLGFLVCGVLPKHPLMAQNLTRMGFPCRESVNYYDREKFTVEEIRVGALLKFIPVGPELREALAAAISKQSPGGPALRVKEKFNAAGVSFLEAALGQELEERQLKGKTGLIYARHRLVNCNPSARTLEVEYQIITVARPSYVTANFELNEQEDKEEELAGTAEKDRPRLVTRPLVGYDRSRGIYGGTALSYQTGFRPIAKFDLKASGSSSSAVVDASFSGAREYDSGPLNYAEWRFGYRYSNIPTDTIRLKDSTVLGQFFAATHPLGSLQLFLRFGASIEGGNRQTNLVQSSVPASNLVSSGYGAAKMYVGVSLTGRRQDWKISYGLQLGNLGQDVRVDFFKQILDASYRARFLPRDYRPLQLDVQLTAGHLRTVSGAVPVGERFFGGNGDSEFIQGDTWRIRSNPFIRSFPENRLNLVDPGLPMGGESFVSFNLTLAQTVWQRQLMPKEIVRDPDVNAGLGGQLLSTRLFLREETVQRSPQVSTLKSRIGALTRNDENNDPAISKLKSTLQTLQSRPLPEVVRSLIGKFFEADADSGIAPIPDTEAAVAAAELDPNAVNKPLEDTAALAKFLDNPIEGNARRLAVDDEGDPDDADDDTKSLITILQENIDRLRQALGALGTTERGPEITEADNQLGNVRIKLEMDRVAILNGLEIVNDLRTYEANEIDPAIGSLNQASPTSGKKLGQLLTEIRQQLKPLRDSTRQELDALRANSTDTTISQRRDVLIEFRALLDAADTYAEKANSALLSANDSRANRQFYEAKVDLERLAVGFGGIVSYLSGIDTSVRNLRGPLTERGLTPLRNALRTNTEQLLAIQNNVRRNLSKVRIPVAEAEANKTVSYVGRVLQVFFRELNLVGVSPVLMFDAARLGAGNGLGNGGFRYGIGAGIRLSLVNLDVTAGYSINPNRRPGEARGAFVFTLGINDLFR